MQNLTDRQVDERQTKLALLAPLYFCKLIDCGDQKNVLKKLVWKNVDKEKKIKILKKNKFGKKKLDISRKLNDECSKMNVWAKFLGENTLWSYMTVS